jgi:hypothetical protein
MHKDAEGLRTTVIGSNGMHFFNQTNAIRNNPNQRLKRRNLIVAILFGSCMSSMIGSDSLVDFAEPTRADQPLGDIIYSPANRVARFLGIGYSDGYHAAQPRSNCALLDLPPASIYTQLSNHQNAGQAMFAMPAQAYNYSQPMWVESQGYSQGYVAVPSVTPQQPTPVYQPPINDQPTTAPRFQQQAPIPSPSNTPSIAPNGLDPLPKKQQRLIEDIPAPQPRSAPSQSSPSDLAPDPPSSNFFNDDSTKQMLEGLESLESLEALETPDSLGGDTMPRSFNDPLSPDAPETPSLQGGWDSQLEPEKMLESDMGGVLEDLPAAAGDDSLLPAESGSDDDDLLLNTQYRGTSPDYVPRGASRPTQLPQLNRPRFGHQTSARSQSGSHAYSRINEPGRQPNTIETTNINGQQAFDQYPAHQPTQYQNPNTKLPRTAQRVYEPQR